MVKLRQAADGRKAICGSLGAGKSRDGSLNVHGRLGSVPNMRPWRNEAPSTGSIPMGSKLLDLPLTLSVVEVRDVGEQFREPLETDGIGEPRVTISQQYEFVDSVADLLLHIEISHPGVIFFHRADNRSIMSANFLDLQ